MTKSRDIADSINRIDSSAADATAMTIDANENVGIGNSSAQTRLFVGDGSGNEGITIYSGTDSEGQLRFADGTSGSALYQGRIEYNHSSSRLFLGAGGTTNVNIDSAGAIYLGGESAAVNALDDYEEGTWTPTYSMSGASFNMSLQLGAYVKVGRMVNAVARVRGQRVGGSGILAVSGLPFTTNTTANLQPAGSIGFTNGWSTSPKGVIAGANSTLLSFKKSGSSSALSNIVDDIAGSDVSTSSTSSNDIIMSITYMTS